MFVLVLKDSLILETIQKYRGKKKARMDDFADGSFRMARLVRLYSLITK